MTAPRVPPGFKSLLCRCLNEVLVPEDHEGPASCEDCGPGKWERISERVRLEKEREGARQAAGDVVFMERLARLSRGRRFRPGDKTGARCPACRREYVYGPGLIIMPHDCPGAAPKQPTLTASSSTPVQVRRPRNLYDDDEEVA